LDDQARELRHLISDEEKMEMAEKLIGIVRTLSAELVPARSRKMDTFARGIFACTPGQGLFTSPMWASRHL
jgi:hypothetical protein